MIMNKNKSVFTLIMTSLLVFSFSLTALADEVSTPADNSQSNDLTIMIILAAVLSVLAIVSVVLVNKKTAKYRKYFARKKKKK